MKETSSDLWGRQNPTCHQEWHQNAMTQSSQLTGFETQETGCDPQRTPFPVHLCHSEQHDHLTKHESSKNWNPFIVLAVLWLYYTVYLYMGLYTGSAVQSQAPRLLAGFLQFSFTKYNAEETTQSERKGHCFQEPLSQHVKPLFIKISTAASGPLLGQCCSLL